MRRSRRWLIAAMGTSTMVPLWKDTAANGQPPPSPTPDPVEECERMAVVVPALAGMEQPPTDKKYRDALFKAFEIGLNFPPVEGFDLKGKNVRRLLEEAYGADLPDGGTPVLSQPWWLVVLQAFILGSLARFAWKKDPNAFPDSNKFGKRHVLRAWASFKNAMSSAACNSTIGQDYILPIFPKAEKGSQRILQINQPCGLC